ncbi:hypothetical protein C5167_016734 [Papaver somniferum]|uniref:putative FBD-associated F-box protein At5g56440 isoform X1 n=1 Tax=Papaver somniferum TaxID=3469 RepID=UPI000E6F8E71|nr:putative FBD-associated F-box protein At5g56440 isoform X1 [Papaver somniferum]RZC94041.1 hypothetical protein C5167_016734 [Papaver somniferum]
MERGDSSSGEDRISQLPDSIIHHILSFLSDTTYAVQTCVLSKRWRYLWTSLPVLKFSDEFHHRDSDVDDIDNVDGDLQDMCFVNRYIKFVDKVLTLRDNNSDIQIFHFQYSPSYNNPDEKSDRFVNTCIAAAASHNVQELYVKIKPHNDLEFRLLSTCKSLTKLELELSGYDDGDYNNCSIICIPREISFPRLESLCMILKFFPFDDEESTNKFFSSFPNLESLVIVFRGWSSGFRDMNLTISLPKLKCFSFKVEDQGYEINSVIKLYAPSLTSFICNSDMVTSFIVENLPSLVTAEIQICVAASGREKEFYAQRTMGLLRGIRSVKVLTLNFSILKNLELQTDQTCFSRDCLRWVFYILKSFPDIESVSLRISQHHDEPLLDEYREEVKSYPENIRGDYWDAELSLPCMICHLKFVEINGLCGCADELKFLEILLKHATVLEKLVVASDATERDSQLEKRMAKFSEKLLKFPTASKKILIFLKSSVLLDGL